MMPSFITYYPVLEHSNGNLGGGFAYVLCLPSPWEMIQFDEHITSWG